MGSGASWVRCLNSHLTNLRVGRVALAILPNRQFWGGGGPSSPAHGMQWSLEGPVSPRARRSVVEPWPFGTAFMGDGAEIGLPDELGVFGEEPALVTGHRRPPQGTPCDQLALSG